MPAFGSRLWPTDYGAVAYLNTPANSSVTGIAGSATTLTNASGTEGVDFLTYTVPTGQSGFYRLSSNIVNGADSDSGGTHLVTCQITYNDGTAQAAIDLGALLGGGNLAAPVALEFSTANLVAPAQGVIYATEATDIVMFLQHILSSTVPTAGTHHLTFCIEHIA